MAFSWSTFKTRTFTAIIFASVMLTGLLWNRWSFFVLFSVIHFGCWWEYLKLTEKIHHTSIHIYTKLGLMLAGYGLMLWFCGQAYQLAGYGLKENFSLPVSGAGFLLIIIGIFNGAAVNVKAFAMAMLGLIYISLSWGLMIDLNIFSVKLVYANHLPDFPYGGFNPTSIEYKWTIPLVVIAAIWINDTMAYVVGSIIGKRQLSKISPKKTWEGTIGGVLLAMLIAGIIAIKADFHVLLFVVTVIIACIAGTFGDLLESKLKRIAGLKDSGSIMPGHGGFLDRFDSLLLATPAVWLYVNLLM